MKNPGTGIPGVDFLFQSLQSSPEQQLGVRDDWHFCIMPPDFRQGPVWNRRMLVVFPVNPDIMRGEKSTLEQVQVNPVGFVGSDMFHVYAHPEKRPEGGRLR